jgi:cytochrome c
MRAMAMASFTIALTVGTASSAPNAKPGEPNPIFGPCSVCHTVGPNASVGVGPPLNGIVGNRWGSHATFAYSPGMIAGRESGRRWDEATLDAWIAKPRSVVPDTKMQFPGLADAKARQAIIAYLRRFNEAGQAQ